MEYLRARLLHPFQSITRCPDADAMNSVSASTERSSLPASESSKSLREALDSPEQLAGLFAAFSAKASDNTVDDGHDDSPDSASRQQGLEAKLLLSAKLGLALLEKQQGLVDDNKALETKHKELEASLSQLLDRLASSYKENAQLIKVHGFDSSTALGKNAPADDVLLTARRASAGKSGCIRSFKQTAAHYLGRRPQDYSSSKCSE